MKVVRCSVGRKNAGRLARVSESTSVVVRSTSFSILGWLSILISLSGALALGFLLRCQGLECRSPRDATITMALFVILPGIIGWHYVLFSSLRVTSWGLEVVNPLNTGRIAWPDLVRARATPNSMSLRLRTESWSIGVFPIQVSNWEGWFASRANRAEVWAKEIDALRDRRLADRADAVDSGASPVKHWRIRILPLVLSAIPWAIAVVTCYPW